MSDFILNSKAEWVAGRIRVDGEHVFRVGIVGAIADKRYSCPVSRPRRYRARNIVERCVGWLKQMQQGLYESPWSQVQIPPPPPFFPCQDAKSQTASGCPREEIPS